jgi:hypothetical protein
LLREGAAFGVANVEEACRFAGVLQFVLRAGEHGQGGGLGEVESTGLILGAVPDGDGHEAALLHVLQIVSGVFDDRCGTQMGTGLLLVVDAADVLSECGGRTNGSQQHR